MKTLDLCSPRTLIHEGAASLKGIPSAARMSETVLSDLLHVERTTLYLEERPLPGEISHHFFRILEGLKAGAPLQYLVGRAPFMGDFYEVTPACFIPRPETEILVETCLNYFSADSGERIAYRKKEGIDYLLNAKRSTLFIDMGTGSGCIAISLTKRIPFCKMLAIDLREEAIRVARRNGQCHGVSDRISWIVGDLFSPLGNPLALDVIVSNPPYVPEDEMEKLPPEVVWEPRVSLDGGSGGLRYYRRLASEAPPFLKKGGLLFLEIGENQEERVAEIFLGTHRFRLLEIRKDPSGAPRVMVFRRGLDG